jgi:hypothetical protein
MYRDSAVELEHAAYAGIDEASASLDMFIVTH